MQANERIFYRIDIQKVLVSVGCYLNSTMIVLKIVIYPEDVIDWKRDRRKTDNLQKDL